MGYTTIENSTIQSARIQNSLNVNGFMVAEDDLSVIKDLYMGRSILYDDGFIGLATNFSGMTPTSTSYYTICEFNVNPQDYVRTSISVRIHYSISNDAATIPNGTIAQATGVAYAIIAISATGKFSDTTELLTTEEQGNLYGVSFVSWMEGDSTTAAILIKTAGNAIHFSGKIELLSSWGQLSLTSVSDNSRS